jgi:diguanylate cyclase (GGDEF)-like protein
MQARPDDPFDSANLPAIDRAIASTQWLTPLPAMFKARYVAETQAIRCPNNRRVILVMTILFDLFLMAQFQTAPEIVRASALLRCFVVTPTVLLFFILDAGGMLRRSYGGALVMVAVLPTAISVILILRTNAHNPNAIADIYATPLILLATGVVTRLTPEEVFSNVTLSILLFAIAVFFAPVVPAAQVVSLILTEVATGVAAIVFNVQLEARDRRVFLLQASDAINRAALAARNRGLLAETQTDGLTGVANRRCFDETLRAAWAGAVEARHWVGLIIIDIDHFKSFNDFYGHQGGDDCLRLVAAAGGAEVRTSDLFARYGGEEFAVILPSAALDTVVMIAERIRVAVEGLGLRHDGQGSGACVTLSLGAAAMQPGGADDPRRLIEMADANLYAAKRSGRNRVYWRPDGIDPLDGQILAFRRTAP